MNENETVKLISKTISENLTKFIGEQCDNEAVVSAIKENMVNSLNSICRIMDLCVPLPRIEVKIDNVLRQATVSFFDPKTDEEISLGTWISRANEGFYD